MRKVGVRPTASEKPNSHVCLPARNRTNKGRHVVPLQADQVTIQEQQ